MFDVRRRDFITLRRRGGCVAAAEAGMAQS